MKIGGAQPWVVGALLVLAVALAVSGLWSGLRPKPRYMRRHW